MTSSLVLCDSGDHLHPNARGYERMAGAIPLTVVRKPNLPVTHQAASSQPRPARTR